MGGNESPSASDGSSRPVQSVEIERTFDAPWQARAFAIAVATTREGEYSWEEFQERLAAEVERAGSGTVPTDAGIEGVEQVGNDHEEAYYEQWLWALSRLFVESGTLTADEIDARTGEFADGDRTAEEWIDEEGDRDHVHRGGHAHGDGHGHRHAHDH